MPKYDKATVQEVKQRADLRDYIDGCKRKGSQTVKCPFCGHDAFSVEWTAKKRIAHCWQCEQTITNAVDAVMKIDNMEFVEAVEYVAQKSGIFIRSEEDRRKDTVTAQKAKKSFAAMQLEASGLTPEDIIAKTVDDKGNEAWTVPIRPGRVYPPLVADESGDDMLIFYYDLEGRQKTYVKRGERGKPKPYFRLRKAVPSGPKYLTATGANSEIYIPQKVRELYQAGRQIDTLFIQEGEKKAEKACKHGMISVGSQGISNFGTEKAGLLDDIQYIVKKCRVKNLVLMMDSDWFDLHKNIVTADVITKRPNSFSKAVIKFKTFAGSLHNLGLSVDVWWGHVNANQAADKGVDDLLANTLKGREDEILKEIDFAMHAHDGKATYLDIHRITSLSDKKIEDFWLLNNDQEFFNAHRERLKDIDVFTIKRIKYKVEDGKLVQFNKYASDREIWTVTKDDDGNVKKIDINFTETMALLYANGFCRLRQRRPDGLSSYEFIRINDGIIERATTVDIRDYIRDYMAGVCQAADVKEKFSRSIDNWLADKKLENLPAREDDFGKTDPERQRLYYNNGAVEITLRSITAGKVMENVWRTLIQPRKFRRVPVIASIDGGDGSFRIQLTEEGKKCEFYRFLFNSSNMFYGAGGERTLSDAEQKDLMKGVVNKITSLGYLLCAHKFRTEKKAVVLQDRKISQVGQAGGGSGKSIFGEAVSYVIPQIFINGKSDDNDKFYYQQVNQATRNVLIDDIRTNLNFKNLYPLVTGKFIVERKNTEPLTLEFESSPKVLITTNDTINGFEEDATKRRISYVEMSQWYNPAHTLVMDFGHEFFTDWDSEQWNLFDNLMAECVMFYLRSIEECWSGEKGRGIVPPPMGNIQLRSLRQQMSEIFFMWAEEYFTPEAGHLNTKCVRKDMFESCMEYASGSRHDITRAKFRAKLECYCRYKGYDINPQIKNEEGYSYADFKREFPETPFFGKPYKSQGLEFLTVYNPLMEMVDDIF